MGGPLDNPPSLSSPPATAPYSITSPGDSCFPVSLPLAPPFSTPMGTWRPHCSLFFLVPCLSLPQPNPPFPVRQITSGTHPPIHPVPSSSIPALLTFLPTSPSLTDLPAHLTLSCLMLSSHHSFHRASPSYPISQLKHFPSFKGQLKCQWVLCGPLLQPPRTLRHSSA